MYKKAAVGLAFDLHRKAIAALFLFRMDVLSENIAPHVGPIYAQYGTLYKKAAVGLAFDLHCKAIAALFLFPDGRPI